MDKKNANPLGENRISNRNPETSDRDLTPAQREAGQDMEADKELSASSPNDDLDESELARLGEDDNPVE